MQKQKVSERELARRMFNGPKINKDKDGTKKESNKVRVLFFCRSMYLIVLIISF